MYLLLALGIFFIIDLVLVFYRPDNVRDVRITQGVLGIGSVVLYYGLGRWYLGFGVAGAAILFHRLADLLLAIANNQNKR